MAYIKVFCYQMINYAFVSKVNKLLSELDKVEQ